VARREVDKPALEPQFLQRVWYWDDFYDTVIGRPSQKLATFFAWVVDARVIDGAVNGTANLVRLDRATRPASCRPATCATTRSASPSGMAAHHRVHLSRTWWS
jgi:NADH:ubiquinone oxidoreductase subunit 5 (subunit L)/multisubunit Na+/H+ antiporter MnhA subunit